MFASRWEKDVPMHPGWLLKSEVVRAVSDSPEGPFQFEEVVLPARGAQFWDGRSTHNPHIMKYNGMYILYYTGITHPFPDDYDFDARVYCSRASKRIGIQKPQDSVQISRFCFYIQKTPISITKKPQDFQNLEVFVFMFSFDSKRIYIVAL